MKTKTLRNKKEDTANIKDLLFAIEELTLLVEALQEAVEASPRVVYLPSAPIIIERQIPNYYPMYPIWQNPNIMLCKNDDPFVQISGTGSTYLQNAIPGSIYN